MRWGSHTLNIRPRCLKKRGSSVMGFDESGEYMPPKLTEQQELDKIHACHSCGSRGYLKGVLSYKGRLMLLCHDGDKTCFEYVRDEAIRSSRG